MSKKIMSTSLKEKSSSSNYLKATPEKPCSYEKSKSNLNLPNKFKSNKSSFKSFFALIFMVILMLMIFSPINCDIVMTITIKGTGTQSILFYNSELDEENPNPALPDKIKINSNEEITSGIDYKMNLDSDINTIIMTWTTLTSCKNMFKNMNNLQKIELKNMDISSVTNMEYFCFGCTSLESADFSNTIAVNVRGMDYMLCNCKILTSVNFNNFQTEKLNNINCLFSNSKAITSIDLSSFTTPNLILMSSAFYGCESLKYINFGGMETTHVTHMDYMFAGCIVLESLDLSGFVTTSVITMAGMFSNCNNLVSLDLSSFHTPNLESMQDMFFFCVNLTSVNLENFDTRKVINMGKVFDQCHSIKSLNLSHFHTDSMSYMYHMFYYCYSLEYLDISNFNTSNITEMSELFNKCYSLKSLNISNFDTSKVTVMNFTFSGCHSLEYIDLRNFDTTLVKNFEGMFENCKSLKTLNLNHFYTPNLEKMNSMFKDCHVLSSLDIGHIDTSKVQDMTSIFLYCQKLTSLDVTNFNTSSATNMGNMFRECNSLTSLNLTNFNTESVTSMGHMFDQCNSVTSLDLKNFYTPNLKNIDNLFYANRNLVYLDITNFNTSKITNMNTIFYDCRSLTTLDLSNFDTRNTKTMIRMFNICSKLTSLNISNFYTPNLEYMDYMFYECRELVNLDISNLNTSKVKTMNSIFCNCWKLTSLDLSNFDTTNVYDMTQIFNACTNLVNLNINSFNTSKVTNFTRMFDQCQSLTSLDLSHFDTDLMIDMTNMFYNCKSLKYLELTNFNTQKITNMKNLFRTTKSLIFLNLSSFDVYNTTEVSFIFEEINKNVTLCYNKSRVSNDFEIQASPYRYSCFEICVYHLNKKYILDTEECVDNCYEQSIYKYEYNNICYSTCPKKTEPESITSYKCVECLLYYNYHQDDCISVIDDGYYLNDTEKKTIDKCPIECSKCSKDSVDINLCIECNEDNNYYNKLNDELSINTFYKCYNTIPEGYYLDQDDTHKQYKPCYEKCKTCDEGGDINNNNCLECKDEYEYNSDNKNCLIKTAPSINVIEQPKIITEQIEKSDEINQQKGSDSLDIKDNSSLKTDGNIKDNIYQSSNLNEMTQKIEQTQNVYDYSYEMNIELEEFNNLKQNYQHAFIDFNEQTISSLKNQLSLNPEEKIFIHISENTQSDNVGTVDYTYEFFYENGTKLDINNITENIIVDIYVPLTDLDLINYELAKKYSELGYDIYNINSKFYTDYCIPVYLGNNDITIKDRKKDIYPQNITLCKNNCIYKGINLEERRVICSCNLNDNNINNNTNIMEESEENFVIYLLDKINYKVYLCYKLFFNISNLKSSYAFFIILSIYILLQIINSIYLSGTLKKLKNDLIKEMPKFRQFNKELNTEFNKMKDPQYIREDNQIANPTKSNKEKSNNKSKPIKNKVRSEKNLLNEIAKENLMNTSFTQSNERFSSKNENETKVKTEKKKKKSKKRNSKKKLSLFKERNIIDTEEKYNKILNKEDNINELPYSKAINEDKRNIIHIYYSFLIDKLDLINIICSDNKIKIILYEEFILSLIINFSINALLYSDDVISNKYHNNGELEFIVSLVLSIISNIVTSLLCNYIKYTEGVEDKINLILETKYKIKYIKNIEKLLSYLKMKFIIFFICQLIFCANCIYYTVIFCILYSRSQMSLIINFCYSFIESIITAFIISFIILITRKIGLCCLNKELYNTSKYINNKF